MLSCKKVCTTSQCSKKNAHDERMIMNLNINFVWSILCQECLVQKKASNEHNIAFDNGSGNADQRGSWAGTERCATMSVIGVRRE